MKQTTNMSRVIGEIQSIGRKINKDWFNGELDMERVIFSTTSTPRVYGHFTPYLSYRIHDKATGERGAVEIPDTSNHELIDKLNDCVSQQTDIIAKELYLQGMIDRDKMLQ